MSHIIFTFQDFWKLYVGFIVFLLTIIIFDLGVFHRKAHVISLKEASTWSLIWISVALVFNYWFYLFCLSTFSEHPQLIENGKSALEVSKHFALEFLTGYLVEKSLAIDNIFVFVVIFNYFSVPKSFQHRILFFGILGAILFRGLFIGMGGILLHYEWILFIFGIFLIFTGIKLCFSSEKKTDLSKNKLLLLLHRILPIKDTSKGLRFFIQEGSKLFVTPLFVTLVMIEFSDIIFAVDSVPAIFAITKEPFIVFSSNMLALLGLRSLYFLLAESVDIFHLLKYGLGIILVFVGLKMIWLNGAFNGKFPIVYSLIFIAGVLISSMALSVLFPRKKR